MPEYYDHLCACGCGGWIEVKWWHKYSGVPKHLPHHQSSEVKQAKSIGACRRWKDPSVRAKHCGDRHPSKRPEVRKKISDSNKGKKQSAEFCEKRSVIQKSLWQNPEYVRIQMRARNAQQNKAEKKLQDLLDQNFPGFTFVGDGKKIISGKCPDFVNEEKKLIIELFGDYWHNPDGVEPRMKLFESQGYKTLVIWEHELKELEDVIQRIKGFTDEC